MSIVSNLTISGFKVIGSDCDPSTADVINTTIPSSSIYQYQASGLGASNLVSSGGSGPAEPPIITLTKLGDSSKIGGGKTVDTLSIMLKCVTSSDYVLINGGIAINGVGYSSSTVGGYTLNDWAVYPPQVTNGGVPSNTPVGNSPAYTVTSNAGANNLTQVNFSGTYLNNYALNVVEGLNRVFIQIYSDSTRATLKASYTYLVSIVSSSTRLASLTPTISPVPIVSPGYKYDPDFNSTYCAFDNLEYTLNVVPGTTGMTLTPVVAVVPTSGQQTISIITADGVLPLLTSGQTTELFDVSNGDILSVIVTAADGVTQQTYTIGVDFDLGNNNLSSVALSYYQNNNTKVACDSSTVSWKSGNVYGRNPTTANLELYNSYSYINTIPNDQLGVVFNVTSVDASSSITISVNGVASGVTVEGTGQFFIVSTSLVNGLNTIVCTCTSELGVPQNYTFQLWVGSTSSALANIQVEGGVLDSTNPFDPLNVATYDSLALLMTASEAGELPTYNVYVTPSSSATTINIISVYSDNGSRISYNGSATAPGSWDPTVIDNYNSTTDNWTQGANRSKNISVSSSTGISTQLTIATYIPEGLYSSSVYNEGIFYGYKLNIYHLPAGLINLSLADTNTTANIPLYPGFQSAIQTYTAYIGNNINPTNVVDLTVVYNTGSNYLVDYSTTSSGSYDSTKQLKNGVETTAELGTDSAPPQRQYTIYVRIFTVGSTGSALSWYKLDLLNIDSSLVLSNLVIKQQSAPSTTTGKYPNPPDPGTNCTLSPDLNSSASGMYNVPVPSLYCYIKPVVANANVKTITVTIAGVSQVVASGTPVNFAMSSSSIPVVITVSDKYAPANFNSYNINVYSNSTLTDLAVVNFTDFVILGDSFTAPLPNGTTITSISDGTYTASTSVTHTRITASPVQAGSGMSLSYIKTISPFEMGYETLAPGVPSTSLIPLIAGTTQNVRVFVQPNLLTTAADTFNFNITQIQNSDSSLSNIVFTNCSAIVFVPSVLNYSLSLINGNTTFKFTPTASYEYGTTISYVYNGGSAVTIESGDQSASITAVNYGILSVTVTAQDSSSTVYTFNITRPINSFLTGLKVYLTEAEALATGTAGSVALNPSPFSSTVYSYAAEVGSSQDYVYAVVSHSSESAIDMTNGTFVDNNNDDSGEVWVIPVTILDTENVLDYQVNANTITVSASGVANHTYQLSVFRERPTAVAQSITLNVYDPSSSDPYKRGAAIPLNDINGDVTPFDPYNFTYTLSTAYRNQRIVISVVGVGYNRYFLQALPYGDPMNYVITDSQPFLVKAQSTVNISEINTYQISILVPEVSYPLPLAARKMNIRRR
jgi:hypothetical protein